MNNERGSTFSIALTALATVAFFTAIAIMFLVAPHIKLPIVPQTRMGSTQISISLIFIAWVVCVFVQFVLTFRLIDKWRIHQVSIILVALIIVIASFTEIVTVQAVAGVDLVLHDWTPEWRFYSDPEVRIITNLFLFGIPLGLAMLGWNALKG